MLVLFALFFIIFLTLLALSYGRGRPTKNYACGEKPVPSPNHENFYRIFYSSFPRLFRALEKMHTEKLTDYIYYLLLTLALLLLVVIAAWL